MCNQLHTDSTPVKKIIVELENEKMEAIRDNGSETNIISKNIVQEKALHVEKIDEIQIKNILTCIVIQIYNHSNYGIFCVFYH